MDTSLIFNRFIHILHGKAQMNNGSAAQYGKEL
jgi:hypothetical protein